MLHSPQLYHKYMFLLFQDIIKTVEIYYQKIEMWKKLNSFAPFVLSEFCIIKGFGNKSMETCKEKCKRNRFCYFKIL